MCGENIWRDNLSLGASIQVSRERQREREKRMKKEKEERILCGG